MQRFKPLYSLTRLLRYYIRAYILSKNYPADEAG
nr:MAG TPA: hypothetical protein [Caudoviricetes sp.]